MQNVETDVQPGVGGRLHSQQQRPQVNSSCNESAGSIVPAGRLMVSDLHLCSKTDLNCHIGGQVPHELGCKEHPWANGPIAVTVAGVC